MDFSIPIAAIDVGSNAIRFMVAEAKNDGSIVPIKKFRKAIRLGHDTFTEGKIASSTIKRTVDAFQKFRKVINNRKILHYRAVATSALRDASNGKETAEAILAQAGIKLEVIDAMEEGRLIHLAVSKNAEIADKNVLLMDIGGGSVELTHSLKGKILACKTFPAGTVRLLEIMNQKKLSEDNLPDLAAKHTGIKEFIDAARAKGNIDMFVGTGGNFESLGRLRKMLLERNSSNKFTVKDLNYVIAQIKKTDIKERMDKFDIHSDRADVILPAATMILKVMTEADIEKCHIPGCGLKEGLLYEISDKLLA
ncbi:hypothetical protein K1X76_07730 [bacterium]|nr:hypothetical protein [bacterium]